MLQQDNLNSLNSM